MAIQLIEILAENLQYFRRERGFTQKQIALMVGVSFQQVQKYEQGKNRIPVDKLYLLAQVYQLSMDDFFIGRGC